MSFMITYCIVFLALTSVSCGITAVTIGRSDLAHCIKRNRMIFLFAVVFALLAVGGGALVLTHGIVAFTEQGTAIALGGSVTPIMLLCIALALALLGWIIEVKHNVDLRAELIQKDARNVWLTAQLHQPNSTLSSCTRVSDSCEIDVDENVVTQVLPVRLTKGVIR